MLLNTVIRFLDMSDLRWDHQVKCWEFYMCNHSIIRGRLRMMPLGHLSGESIAYDMVIQDGGLIRVVYVTDTTLDVTKKDKRVMRFVRALKNGIPIDLLITECNFAKRHRELAVTTRHTSSDMLVSFLHYVRPKRVVLTHVHPFSHDVGEFCDEDRIAFEEVHAGVPEVIVEMAHDNLIVEVGV